MKFQIQKDTLLYNLNNVSRALSTKVQMPGLTGILFHVSESNITLTSSNNDISIKTIIDKDFTIFEPGDFIVQGKYLIEIVRKLTSSVVDFVSYEENEIKVLSGKSIFTLNQLELQLYPAISFEDSQLHFEVSNQNLKQLIKNTSFAISNSESRIILTGVSIVTQGNKLEFVATDSFRLARKQVMFDNQLPNVRIVVPGKSLDELLKILEDNDEVVDIHITSQKILFKFKNIYFQSRLINGVFPNVDSLIPERYLLSLKFNKEELIQTIDRVSIFVINDISNIIKLSISSDKNVEFISTSTEVGGAVEEVTPIERSSEMSFDVSLSSKYFLDAVKTFNAKEITLNFTGEIKPITIQSDTDTNLIQLILPVRG